LGFGNSDLRFLKEINKRKYVLDKEELKFRTREFL
jgi:hypothetical protein